MKTPLTIADLLFNLNFFLVGGSGSGKTHLAGTYTKGPVHFYMTDKGGSVTLNKLVKKRGKNAPPISVDDFSADDSTFSDLFTALQKDEEDGFFQEMKRDNGLLCFDSITTMNIKAIYEIMTLNKRTGGGVGKKYNDAKDGMRTQDWGQLLQWMSTLISTIQSLPCATCSMIHLHLIMDKEGNVISRAPSVNGQFRQLIGINYDETYLLENRGSKRIIHFQEKLKFQAKSRAFSCPSVTNITMDTLAEAYVTGDTMEGRK